MTDYQKRRFQPVEYQDVKNPEEFTMAVFRRIHEISIFSQARYGHRTPVSQMPEILAIWQFICSTPEDSDHYDMLYDMFMRAGFDEDLVEYFGTVNGLDFQDPEIFGCFQNMFN